MSDLIGKTLSHFEIREIIGSGGMGDVFRAFDLHLEREVAVKVLRDDFLISHGGFQVLRREALALSRLQHPNILTVYDYDQVDGHTFICMELVEGVTLRTLLRKGHLTAERALGLAVQVCSALEAAHEKNLLHRDIKPENIMITASGTVKLMDFGLAQTLARDDSVTRTYFQAGTLGYCSPESLSGEADGPQRDIYAFGVVLTEMVTGELPFVGDTPTEVMRAILTAPPRVPSQIRTGAPTGIDDVVIRCLTREKSQRFASATELREAVARLAAGASPSGGIPRATAPATKNRLRRPALVAGVGALVAIAAIITVVFGMRGGRRSAGNQLIALVPFTNDTGSEDLRWLSTGIPLMIFSNFSQFSELRLMSLERTQELVHSLGWTESDLRNTGAAVALAGRAGATVIVRGRVSHKDGALSIVAEVLDGTTGKLMVEEHADAATLDALLGSVSSLARDLAIRVAEDIVPHALASEQRSVEDLTTTSVEAFKFYALGEEAWNLWRHEDAVKYLGRALEIDSTFAMASYRISHALGWLNEVEASSKALEQAYRHSARVPERDRLLIRAQWESEHGDSHAAAATLDTLTGRYPSFREAFALKGDMLDALALEGSGSIESSIEAYRTAITIDPEFPFGYNDLAYALAHAKRYDEAIVQLKKYVELAPKDPNPHDSIGEMFLHQGRFQDALRHFDSALEIDPMYVQTLRNAAGVRVTLGEYDAAIKMADRLEEATRSTGMKAVAKALRAAAYLGKGQDDAARQEIEAELALRDRQLRVLPLARLADLAISRGEYDRARGYIEDGYASVAPDPAAAPRAKTAAGLAKGPLAQDLFLRLCTGDTAGAAACLDTLLAASSAHQDLFGLTSYHVSKSQILRARGDYEAAIEELRKSIELLPSQPSEGEARVRRLREIADLMVDAGEPADARALADSLLLAIPKSLVLTYTAARAEQALRNPAEVTRCLDTCDELLRFADDDSHLRQRLLRGKRAVERGEPMPSWYSPIKSR